MTKFRPWTATEDAFLREHKEALTNEQLSARLRWRSPDAVKDRMRRLCIGRERPANPSHWTDEENQYLREHYKSKTYAEIAEALPGRTDDSVRHRMRALRLRAKPAQRKELLPRDGDVADSGVDRIEASRKFIEELLKYHGDRADVKVQSDVENVYRAPTRVTPFSYSGSPAAMCAGVA